MASLARKPLSCGGVISCLPHRTLLAGLSDCDQHVVFRGESPQPKDLEVAPRLQNPKGFSITIANHPCRARPVLTLSDHDDVVLIMRCLAHRRDTGERTGPVAGDKTGAL